MKPEHRHRVTPDYVTHLKDNEIFVFGSNIQEITGSTHRFKIRAVMGRGWFARLLWYTHHARQRKRHQTLCRRIYSFL